MAIWIVVLFLLALTPVFFFVSSFFMTLCILILSLKLATDCNLDSGPGVTCYVFCNCLMTTNKNPIANKVELGDQLGGAGSRQHFS